MTYKSCAICTEPNPDVPIELDGVFAFAHAECVDEQERSNFTAPHLAQEVVRL